MTSNTATMQLDPIMQKPYRPDLLNRIATLQDQLQIQQGQLEDKDSAGKNEYLHQGWGKNEKHVAEIRRKILDISYLLPSKLK